MITILLYRGCRALSSNFNVIKGVFNSYIYGGGGCRLTRRLTELIRLIELIKEEK
jgi:hypothetical protein